MNYEHFSFPSATGTAQVSGTAAYGHRQDKGQPGPTILQAEIYVITNGTAQELIEFFQTNGRQPHDAVYATVVMNVLAVYTECKPRLIRAARPKPH